MKTFTCKLAAAFVAACAATPAAGESGSFQLVASFVHDYASMKFGERTVTGGPINGAGGIVESSGGPFADGANYRAGCVVYGKTSGAGIDLEASCAMTDGDGDAWYSIAKRRAGDVDSGGGGRGKQEIIGGTGKYAGVTGSCGYATSYLPDNWLISRSACEWRKP